MQKPREMLLSTPAGKKKNFEHLPRAPERTDRVQTSTKVSGRPSRVDLPSVLSKSARTTRYVRKQMKN